MRARILTLLIAVAAVGCDAAPAELGLDAALRIPGAQYYPGPMPAESGGPAVTSIGTMSSLVRAGRSTVLSGLVPLGTRAVLVGIPGDRGYWVIQPGVLDLQLADQLTFEARAYFSAATPAGRLGLVARASDDRGRVGMAIPLEVSITDSPAPDGALVVSLRWERDADLDLHVVQPDGVEIWTGNLNASKAPSPGQLPDPRAVAEAAKLDFDSNQGCNLDGRREENVIWTSAPPRGHYLVRVDAFSLCGEDQATWRVEVTGTGRNSALAAGQAIDWDAATAHGERMGVLALEFDVP